MKFIIFDPVLKCDKNIAINKNKFTPQHCSNFLLFLKQEPGNPIFY